MHRFREDSLRLHGVLLFWDTGEGGEESVFADSAKGGVAAEEVVVEWSETNDNAEDIVLKSGAT